MEFKNDELSCKEAREKDMVYYLSALGHEPTIIKGNDYWYLSPLRQEKTASFKVNRKLNKWYDFGIGKGGNLIDFAILYHDCTVGEFLRILNGNLSFQKPHFKPSNTRPDAQPKIIITKEKGLYSTELFLYLRERRIPAQIAEQYCREITYTFEQKSYYAIGFKNDAGGFELRNRYFKNSSSPKAITTIKNGASEVSVFEGFFDFLSYLEIFKNTDVVPQDFIILNSLSFFEAARLIIEAYPKRNLYLDNDKAGQNCSSYACEIGNQYNDASSLYRNYKDLNDFLLNRLIR